MNSKLLSSKNSLTKLKNQSLKLSDELPEVYASPLAWFEKIFAHGEAAYLLALLTGLSVCHNSSTRLKIPSLESENVPLNIYTGIVGESGTGKTPLVQTVI